VLAFDHPPRRVGPQCPEPFGDGRDHGLERADSSKRVRDAVVPAELDGARAVEANVFQQGERVPPRHAEHLPECRPDALSFR